MDHVLGATVGQPDLTPPQDHEVRDLLRAELDEPDLSTAARAVDAVVRDYLREAGKDGHRRAGSWPSVRTAVRCGVPAAVLVRSLWRSHMCLMDGLVDPLAHGATDARRRALTSFTFYCCEDVAQAYGNRVGTRLGGHDRQTLVERILHGDGTDTDVGEVEQVLGIRCSDNHWATVLWSTGNGDVRIEDLIKFSSVVARSVNGSDPLVVLDNVASHVLMWTGWPPQRPRPEVIASARAQLRLPDGLRVCSGPVLPGLIGFRRSMLLAREARKIVGTSPGTGWHHYAEASPVSLLVGDREGARWFVEDRLGALSHDDARTAILRETLRLYLAHGRSRQQVAAIMYINRNTVAYRVQKAEELLGRPIDQDTFELRLALEIVRRDCSATAREAGTRAGSTTAVT